MKLGFFTMPMHPPGRNYTQTLKEDREAVLLADRLGLCEAFIGEHATDICETIPSCLAFIASVAFETKQIKLGSAPSTCPRNNGRLRDLALCRPRLGRTAARAAVDGADGGAGDACCQCGYRQRIARGLALCIKAGRRGAMDCGRA